MRLPVTATEVFLRFRRPPRPVLDETGPRLPSYYRFRLSPDMVLALGTKVKSPGELMVGERIELMAHHQHSGERASARQVIGHHGRMGPMRTNRRFSPDQLIVPVTSKQAAVEQLKSSPTFLPLSHTAAPNRALPILRMATSRFVDTLKDV